jgi:hypothetical protein
MRNYYTTPTVYYMHHSDKRFECQHENTVRTNMQFWYSIEKFTCETPESSQVHKCIYTSKYTRALHQKKKI